MIQINDQLIINDPKWKFYVSIEVVFFYFSSFPFFPTVFLL